MEALMSLATVLMIGLVLLIPRAISEIMRSYRKRKNDHRAMIRKMIIDHAEELRKQGWNVTVEDYE
jgi:hypothetical protein